MKKLLSLSLASLLFVACSSEKKETITDLSQLASKEFAVPTGTMADQLVMKKFPNAKFKYFNTVSDCAAAVKTGKVDAAAYDEPILKNIAAKTTGIRVLKNPITIDHYGFAVSLGNKELKSAIDTVINDMRANGEYDKMKARWLPEKGEPAPMPEMTINDTNGTLRFGTSAVTEPFSFISSQGIVGLDIEIASLIAQKLGKKLELVNMDFGAMIPALAAGKVDFIGACITISEERSKKVLFSTPYYTGGISALVKQ